MRFSGITRFGDKCVLVLEDEATGFGLALVVASDSTEDVIWQLEAAKPYKGEGALLRINSDGQVTLQKPDVYIAEEVAPTATPAYSQAGTQNAYDTLNNKINAILAVLKSMNILLPDSLTIEPEAAFAFAHATKSHVIAPEPASAVASAIMDEVQSQYVATAYARATDPTVVIA